MNGLPFRQSSSAKHPALWKYLGFTLIFVTVVAALLHFTSNRMLENQAGPTMSSGLDVTMTGYPSWHLPEEAARLSDLVVIAKITDIGQARWNTSDGLRPPEWRSDSASLTKWMIYTPVSFEVTQSLSGSAPMTPASQFAVAGGRVGVDRIDVSEAIPLYADVQIGDQVVLFLKTAENDIQYVAPLVYIDAFRVEGGQAGVDCKGSRAIGECRVKYDLADVIARVATTQ